MGLKYTISRSGKSITCSGTGNSWVSMHCDRPVLQSNLCESTSYFLSALVEVQGSVSRCL